MNNHSYHIKHLKENPKEIGLEGVLWATTEILFKDGRRDLAEIDILYYTGNYYKRPYIVVEYKDSFSQRTEAMQQLEKYSKPMREYFGEAYYLFVCQNKKDKRRYYREHYGAPIIKSRK